jgi:hypothetical protein
MPCRTKKSSTCLHLLMHIFMLHGVDPLVEEAVNSTVINQLLFKLRLFIQCTLFLEKNDSCNNRQVHKSNQSPKNKKPLQSNGSKLG